MSWPKTSLTPYVANSPPVIKADDLNALQAAVGNFVRGDTWSLAQLLLDGVGAQAVTLAAGVVLRVVGKVQLVGDTAVTGALAATGALSALAGTISNTLSAGVLQAVNDVQAVNGNIAATAGTVKAGAAKSSTGAAPGPALAPGEAALESIALGWAKVRFDGSWKVTRHLNLDSYSHPAAGKWTFTFHPTVSDSAEVAVFATINARGDEDYQVTAEVTSAGSNKITVEAWTAQLSAPGGGGALTKTYANTWFSVFLFPSGT